MFKNIQFESERLKTKRLSEEDVVALFQIYSDSEAMKFRGSKPMQNKEDAYHMLANQFTVHDQISKLRLGLWDKSKQQLIGTLLLTWEEHAQEECEIGFSFGRNYWRQGYGKETLRMVEATLRIQDHIERLKAWCIKENFASVSIFNKAGFSELQQSEYPQSYLFMKKIK